MKDIALSDRPREKLLRHGPAALGDNELLAIIIGAGSRRAGALATATELLAAHGGLRGVRHAGIDELMEAGGIGEARAGRILAAIELGRRTFSPAPSERVPIRGPADAAAYLLPRFGSSDVEQFGILLLDTKHRVFRTCVLAVGTENTSVVEPREVFREAARKGAAAIVVFHTHPSGDPTPSADDTALTERLAAAGALVGIDVVDHVILGDVTYVSFKETRRL